MAKSLKEKQLEKEKEKADLEALEKMFDAKGLEVSPWRFAIYVPFRLKFEDEDGRSGDREIHPARHRVLVSMAKNFLCEKLGGLTAYKAKGSWFEDTGHLHEEKVLVLESYCPSEKLVMAGKAIKDFANALAIEFEQSQMACVVNGKMVFFQPEPRYKEIHKFIAIDAPDEKRDLESVVWKYVLGPLRDAGIPSVFGPLR